jgi:hypothetical protein
LRIFVNDCLRFILSTLSDAEFSDDQKPNESSGILSYSAEAASRENKNSSPAAASKEYSESNLLSWLVNIFKLR